MKPDNLTSQSKDPADDRAATLSSLYPQPAKYSRSFIHAPHLTTKAIPSERIHMNHAMTIFSGLALSLPFITFEIGRSTLTNTSTLAEVVQIGMIAVVYLALVTSLAILTFKLFTTKIQITIMSPTFSYWAIQLFSIPVIVMVKEFFLNGTPTLAITAVYHLGAAVIFASTTFVFTYLDRISPINESRSRKLMLALLILPYLIGGLSALVGSI